MKIGQAAVTSGLSVKAIRHYDNLGLLGGSIGFDVKFGRFDA